MKIKIKKSYLDYLLPLIIWIIIFYKNIFNQLVFLDYATPTFPILLKLLKLTNYSLVINPLHLFYYLLKLINLIPYTFQISVLLGFLLSFFYIKKLLKNRIHYLLFAFIYFFNPFVYSKIMVGQIGVLLSYLFIPLFIYYMFQFFKNDFSKKSLIKLSLATTFAGIFSIHFFIINIIILLTAFFWNNYKNPYFKFYKFFISTISIIILLILLNSFWLQGFINNSIISDINKEHMNFFSPKMSENIPAVVKIMGMWGFWREVGYKRTYKTLPSYIWMSLMLILLIIFIYSYFFTDKSKIKSIFFTLFWIGLILGTGISHPYFSDIFNTLFNNLPLFSGFRDSHKLVSLIALAYAYIIPLSLIKLKQDKNKLFFPITIIFFIFFIFISYPLINLNNQIKPIIYPNDYKELNDFLNNKSITGHIIYIPWENYLTYNWSKNSSSDGRITVPINSIIRNNILIGNDKYGKNDDLRKNIKECLNKNETKCLESINIEFIIKDKCAIFPQSYNWLQTPIYENNCIELYKLNNGPKIAKSIPNRFIIGLIISIITIILLIYFLLNLDTSRLS